MKGNRTQFNPKARKVLEQHGNKTIKQIYVARKPLQGAITFLGNIISKGKLSQKKNALGYDNIFHLFLLFELEDGTRVRTDKQAVPELSLNTTENSDTRYKKVPLNKKITLSQFLLKGMELMKGDFYVYSMDKLNCQDYVNRLLTANGLNNNELKAFVLQDAISLVKTIPNIPRKILDIILKFATRADVLVRGKGKQRRTGLFDTLKKMI